MIKVPPLHHPLGPSFDSLHFIGFLTLLLYSYSTNTFFFSIITSSSLRSRSVSIDWLGYLSIVAVMQMLALLQAWQTNLCWITIGQSHLHSYPHEWMLSKFELLKQINNKASHNSTKRKLNLSYSGYSKGVVAPKLSSLQTAPLLKWTGTIAPCYHSFVFFFFFFCFNLSSYSFLCFFSCSLVGCSWIDCLYLFHYYVFVILWYEYSLPLFLFKKNHSQKENVSLSGYLLWGNNLRGLETAGWSRDDGWVMMISDRCIPPAPTFSEFFFRQRAF